MEGQGTMKPGSVWCVGRNYVEHIKELGPMLNLEQIIPTTPMIFMKSGATVVQPGSTLHLPTWSNDVHHEVELAVEIGDDLKPSRIAVGIDLTARDVQVHNMQALHVVVPSPMSHAIKYSLMATSHLILHTCTDVHIYTCPYEHTHRNHLLIHYN